MFSLATFTRIVEPVANCTAVVGVLEADTAGVRVTVAVRVAVLTGVLVDPAGVVLTTYSDAIQPDPRPLTVTGNQIRPPAWSGAPVTEPVSPWISTVETVAVRLGEGLRFSRGTLTRKPSPCTKPPIATGVRLAVGVRVGVRDGVPDADWVGVDPLTDSRSSPATQPVTPVVVRI